MANIIKISHNRIAAITNRKSITLDFNPILDHLANQVFFEGFENNFLLSHWNKLLALPAYFCPQTQDYFSTESTRIEVLSPKHFWVEVKRTEILPSCVLYYPNASMGFVEEKLIISTN